jgi:hypothetical protein
MLRALMIIAAAVVLAACATGYQSQSLTGGFTTAELRPDVVRVRYAGNGFTSKETAQTFWLYRSAEVTLEKGYDGFEILSDMHFVMVAPRQDFDNRTGSHMILASSGGAVPASPEEFAQARAWRRDRSFGAGGCAEVDPPWPQYAAGGTIIVVPGATSVSHPSYEGDIHLLRRPFAGAPPKVFDARALKAAIEPYMHDDKCGTGNVCPHVHEYLLPKGKL